MKPFEGMSYPATDIEHTFARIVGAGIGKRGENWDADMFRGGYTQSIGKALGTAADALRHRINSLPADAVPDRTKRLNHYCDELEGIGKAMAQETEEPRTRDDYRWFIVSSLLPIIHDLLDREGC